MKLTVAVATTSVLAINSAGFSPQPLSRSDQTLGCRQMKPLLTQPNGGLVDFSSCIRSPQSYDRLTMSALTAVSGNHELKPDDTEEVSEQEIIVADDNRDLSSYLVLDELKALRTKYCNMIKRDTANLVESQFNLLLALLSEQLEEVDEKHEGLIESIDYVIDILEGLGNRVGSISEHAKQAISDFMKLNITQS